MFNRKEIDATLSRLRKAENDLGQKEAALREREIQLRERENRLVSSLSAVVNLCH